MSDECIHGLANGLCASCFPKAAPEPSTASRVTKPRASRAREAATPTALRSAPVATAPAVKAVRSATSSGGNVAEQRIYHVTHISNLPGILASGALLPDASEARDAPVLDIASEGYREARRSVVVTSAERERTAAEFVPFFLSPDSLLWESIRSHEADPRLAPTADDWVSFDFVVLVSTVGKAGEAAGAAVADGDAAGPLTRFGTTTEARERMLRALRADKDSDAILAAEFLVEESFPFELVTLIGVANDKVRDAVKEILSASGFRPKVAVYPPWFRPSEDLA
ncbi:DarT ssDNA thymidine ADP-ribosyltransferase family protein [Glaciibacter sp. 2TAF33]|uniref:DarT ssDNA thymidine ADP-ribosyltransferase family protein n=1 Tax=Glaciibacter sp. 2TAF33 TaxID=3233015 RepID=UPI003F930E38